MSLAYAVLPIDGALIEVRIENAHNGPPQLEVWKPADRGSRDFLFVLTITQGAVLGEQLISSAKQAETFAASQRTAK